MGDDGGQQHLRKEQEGGREGKTEGGRRGKLWGYVPSAAYRYDVLVWALGPWDSGLVLSLIFLSLFGASVGTQVHTIRC